MRSRTRRTWASILLTTTFVVGALLAPGWILDWGWNLAAAEDDTIALGIEDLQTAALPAQPPAHAARTAGTRMAAQLTDIRVDEEDGLPTVRIATSQPVRTTTHYLKKPDRLLLKVLGAKLLHNPSTLPVNQPPLERIRAAQHEEGAWVVLDLTRPVRWDVQREARGVVLSLPEASVATDTPPVRQSASTVQHLGEPEQATYQVTDVAVDDTGEKTRLIVTTDGLARYRLEREKNGASLVMTIHGAALSWKGRLSQLPSEVLKRVTVRELKGTEEPVVRLVADLTEPTPYLVFKNQNQVVLEFNRPGRTTARQGRHGNLRTPISVDLQDAALMTVLRALAQDAGFDMIFTPGVEAMTGPDAKVTLSINDQPFSTVLDFILRPRQLAYALDGNTLRIGMASEFPTETRVFTLKNLDVKQSNLKASVESALTEGAQGRVVADAYANRLIVTAIPSDMRRITETIQNLDVQRRLVTRSFPLAYTQGQKIRPLVESGLSSLGSIQENQSENALVVTDIPGNLAQVARLIRSLDTPAKQVMIEARIVEVSLTNETDLGVDWSAGPQNPAANPSVSASSNPVPGKKVGEIVFGTVQAGVDVNATLSLMEAKGAVNVISNPRIATLNNQSATLRASQNIPYATSRVSNGVVTTVVEYLELPITLTVTPQITRDGQVMLNPMTLTVTTVVNDSNPPATTTRSATTQMGVGDGDTVVIGGLVRDEESQQESKVPLLGDIPLLGYLFKSTVMVKNKVELVVFLTPHILE